MTQPGNCAFHNIFLSLKVYKRETRGLRVGLNHNFMGGGTSALLFLSRGKSCCHNQNKKKQNRSLRATPESISVSSCQDLQNFTLLPDTVPSLHYSLVALTNILNPACCIHRFFRAYGRNDLHRAHQNVGRLNWVRACARHCPRVRRLDIKEEASSFAVEKPNHTSPQTIIIIK